MELDPNSFQSPTFCTLPWIHLASNPNGRVKICCMSDEDLKKENGDLFNLAKDSIDSIWNCDQIKDARQRMLNGEKVSACKSCYREEALGGHSMRIGFNEKWLQQESQAIKNRIRETQQNEFVLHQLPWYYDLRQGNLCNLKCRSCSPENSVSIEKESQILANKSDWYKENINQGKPLDQAYKNWFKSDFFNDQLNAQLPNIKKLYFTGGEPTLIEKNFELMQKCVSNNESKHIELMFNTNMTNITDEFLTLLSEFKYVTLNLSIEGIGPVQEYLRGNSKWSKIECNLRKLAENKKKNFSYLVTPVIQNTNVLHFVDMLTYFKKMNQEFGDGTFLFMPIILNAPKHLDINILPHAVKIKAKELIQHFIDTSADFLQYDHYLPVRLQQILSKLDSIKPDDAKDLTEHFIKYTQLLDQERNQCFKTTFPELFGLWSQYDDNLKWEL
jgi:MoaA/NifB/PqqE/SkfB family radical SAM enzyme